MLVKALPFIQITFPHPKVRRSINIFGLIRRRSDSVCRYIFRKCGFRWNSDASVDVRACGTENEVNHYESEPEKRGTGDKETVSSREHGVNTEEHSKLLINGLLGCHCEEAFFLVWT